MLEQQREFYKDLIHQQQVNFKTFVQLIMDGTNKRLDSILRDVQDVKSSLQFTDGVVTELQTEERCIKSKLKEFESAVSSIREEHRELTTKMD